MRAPKIINLANWVLDSFLNEKLLKLYHQLKPLSDSEWRCYLNLTAHYLNKNVILA